MCAALPNPVISASPFDLANTALYEQWCARKLENYPSSLGDLVVEVKDPRALSVAEHEALLARVQKANMAIYVGATGSDPDRNIPLKLAAQFGVSGLNHNWLADDDGLTSLTVVDGGARQHYIPYSNRLIKWHTDGYYNPPERRIRAMVLYTVRPALEGGENELFDPEMAYLQMRDADPAMVAALCHPQAMTIPGNDMDDHVVRGDVSGPVFSLNQEPNLGDQAFRQCLAQNSPHNVEARALGCVRDDDVIVV